MNSDTVDLIYLDPPFNKNRKFVSPFGPDKGEFDDIWRKGRIKEEQVNAIKTEHPKLYTLISAIRDIEGRNSANFCYLVFMAIRLIECHRLLKDTGSIYLHIDPTMSHYLKIAMDYIFGQRNFRNEIIWRIGWVSGFKTRKRGWIRNHDTILYYVKTPKANALFNKEYIPYPKGYTRRDGKPPTGIGFPIEDTWNCHSGDILDSIMIKSFAEKTGYPTEKPLDLLRRIIKASSKPGDMVLDPFCGCATTPIAAAELSRYWIGIDIHKQTATEVKKRMNNLRAKDAKKELAPGEFRDYTVREVTLPPFRTDGGSPAPKGMQFVYIISNPNFANTFKVGRTNDAYRRLNTFQTYTPYRDFALEYKIATPHAVAMEKAIHLQFNADHEWVVGDKDDSKAIRAAKLHDIINAMENFQIA